MIEVSNIDVYGWEAAIRGMRNPMNSWDLSDSTSWNKNKGPMEMILGENDLKLMRNLYKSGTEHRKFMRMIHVSMDIVAPLYWWKEYDTYKVGTVANSCSTMHKIHTKEFTRYNFSHENLTGKSLKMLDGTIAVLNDLRHEYNKTKEKDIWYQMIQLLPSSYNQLRTVDFNYETAVTMIHQRKNHKLDEWRKFVDILKELPHMQDLMETFEEEKYMSKDSFEPQKFLEKLLPDEVCPDDLISRRAILIDILKAMPNDIDQDIKKGEFIGLMMAAKKVINSKMEAMFHVSSN